MISEESTKIESKRRASRQVVSGNHFCSVAFISFRFTINDFFSPPPVFLFLLSWSFFETMRPNSSSTPVSDRDFPPYIFHSRPGKHECSRHRFTNNHLFDLFYVRSYFFFSFLFLIFFLFAFETKTMPDNVYFKVYIYKVDNYYNIFQNLIFICILIGSFKSNSHIFDYADWRLF